MSNTFNPDTWRRKNDGYPRTADNDLEDRIVATLVADLLAHDPEWVIAVNDGEEECLHPCRDPFAIMGALFSTDEDYLLIWKRISDTEQRHWAWVRLIGGNGVDIISDYTTNIPESAMARANAIAAEYQ